MFLGALLASLAALPHISKCAACAAPQRHLASIAKLIEHTYDDMLYESLLFPLGAPLKRQASEGFAV